MFSSKVKIKIEKTLFQGLKAAAERGGYASTEELINHILEREVGETDADSSDEEVEQRLRGLGYIE